MPNDEEQAKPVSRSRHKNVADVRVRYTGDGTQYVPGYPAANQIVTQDEADMLSNSGLYRVIGVVEAEPADAPKPQATPTATDKKEVSSEH